jgi:hypothetical protein
MARLCARPGCSAPAAATFNFDGLNRIVWLNPLTDAAAFSAGDLCWRHAEHLRPPRNWELRDRRRPAPPGQHGAAAPSRHVAPTSDPVPATVARPVPAALLAREREHAPRVEAPASTPLLARAFRGAGRG